MSGMTPFDGSTRGPEGVWRTYVPTLVTGTVGAGGTLTGRYARIGNTIDFEQLWVLGTGFVVSSSTIITTPTLASYLTPTLNDIKVVFTDTGNSYNTGNAFLWSTGVALFAERPGLAGWWDNVNSASMPFAMVAGDVIAVKGSYVAAA